MGLIVASGSALSAPKPEGTLEIALPTAAEEGFLPWIGSGTQGIQWEIVYDYLIYTSPATGGSKPGLAKRWNYSKDYRTMTIWLQEGIPWQEGWGEVTANDVKYTLERCMEKTSSHTYAQEFRNLTKNIEVVGPYTLIFYLQKPSNTFWLMLTTANNGPPIVCKKYVETVGDNKAKENPIGSGSYRFVERRWGDYLKFEAVEKHWRLVPEFKYVILRVVPEASTRVAMLKTRMVDICDITPDKIAELQKASLGTYTLSSGYTVYLNFGGMLTPEDKRYRDGYHRMDPWADVRVREAMNIAIDRKAIAKAVYHGFAKPLAVWMKSPGWDGVQEIPFDPGKAKRLLAAAGYPDGFSFKILSG